MKHGIEKRALPFCNTYPRNIPLFNNPRTNIRLPSRLLSSPLRRGTTNTPGIPDCNTQNRSMAETLTAKVLNARFQDLV
jgi:hypothetical protein